MERRKLNISLLTGMDIRDFNTDQQKVKEIINLVKDKDGWRIRDAKLDVFTNLSQNNDVEAFIMQGDKVLIAIDTKLMIYSITNDVVGNKLEEYDLGWNFKIYKTTQPSVYIVIDTTNHITYTLEFTDRVMTVINDAGDLDQSTELILNEYDVRSGDLTWAGFAKHLPYNAVTQVALSNVAIANGSANVCLHYVTTSALCVGYQVNINAVMYTINSIFNSTNIVLNAAVVGTNANISCMMISSMAGKTMNAAVNKYMVMYDSNNIGTTNEWHEIAAVQQIDYDSGRARYVVITGYGATTGIKLFDFDDYTPYRWTTENTCTNINIFKVDGTGALNDKARFLDVTAGSGTVIDTFTGWNTLEGIEDSKDRFIWVDKIKYYSDSNIIMSGKTPRYNSWAMESWDGTQWSVMGSDVSGILKSNFEYLNANCYLAFGYYGIYKYNISAGYDYYTVQFYLKPRDIKYISDTNIYIATTTGFYHFNGSAYNVNVAWTNLSAGLSGANCNIRVINYTAGTNIFAITANCAVQYGGATWTNVNTGLTGSQTDMLCMDYLGGANVYAGTTAGVVQYIGGATGWRDVNSASLGADQKVQAIDYVNAFYIIAGTETGGVYIYNGSAWVNQPTTGLGSTNVLAVAYGSALKQYVGTSNTGPYYSVYTGTPGTSIDAFIPNDDALGKYTWASDNNAFVASWISLTGKKCLGCKIIDTTFDDNNRYTYAILANSNASTCTSIEVFRLDAATDTTRRETAASKALVTSSTTLSNTLARFTYTNFVGMTVIANQYYELQNSNQKGYTVITAYTDNGNTRFDTIDFVLGTNTSTLTYQRRGVGEAINASSIGYLSNVQCFVWSTGIASIYSGGQEHYVYANKDMRVIRYPITGDRMTTDDVNKITYVYNSEISRYCDPDGLIMGGLVSNPQGYQLTKINSSKKVPIRPYFSINSGDNLWGTTNCNSYELFQAYEMTSSDGSAFRTPIDVDNGSQLVAYSDDGTRHHKYWMAYLLDSGVLDDTIPYINLAKGKKDPVTGSYDIKFWQEDADHIAKVYTDRDSEDIGGSVYRFNNLDIDANDISNVMENGKLFHVIASNTQDQFSVAAYYESSKSVQFEAQDLVFTSNGLMIAIDYENKALYYGYGFKYLNLINQAKLKSRATAIQEIGNNTFAVLCDNDVYLGMAMGEETFNMTYLTSNIGLEKDNYKSLVSNGQDAFFQNRRGVYMIRGGQVVNITPPIEDYAYRNSSGNVLGIDGNLTCLFVPLDYSKMADLKQEFKNGDYTYTADTNVEWNKAFALFNYTDMTYSIFAYTDDQSGYTNTFANMKDHMVMRVGSKLVIPTYKESDQHEDILARVGFKRASFGNVQSLKKLYDVMFYFLNNTTTDGDTLGIDYFKLAVNLNKKVEWSKKHGDFDTNATYSDATITDAVIPDSSTEGWLTMKIPIGFDFNDVEIKAEFSRVNSNSGQSIATLSEMDIDVIQKNIEKTGMR